ncbi:aldose 1-epimerase [Thermoplasma sp.]|uniref:aldose 1-epimerase n=1 Tax=Thermoplasma sp. TaxID=1973142 RepID=UPI0026358675|nr:aldose 1-epimerase [Thermoplasma sp.]
MLMEVRYDNSMISVSEIGSHLDSLMLDGTDILMRSYDDIPTHFGSAFLFPYANRIRNAKYVIDGIEYNLPKNEGNNSIHGLLLNRSFAIAHMDDNSVEMETDIQGGSEYPSHVNVKIRHTITGKSYKCEVNVINDGNTRCPVAAGFHPYFLYENRWEIEDPKTVWKMEYEGYFPTGKMQKMILEADSYKNTFDNQFFADSDILLNTGKRRIRISKHNMPFFVIYNGKYAAGRSVAIEPMMSAVDAFNNGIGLRLVNPGDSISFGYSITLV